MGQRGASAAAAAPTGRSGRLVIYYSPSSATVAVDGVTIGGSSPVTVSDLSPGTHTVRASASGFSTSTREATVEPNGSRDVRLELAPGAPRTATLNIVTTPSGAQVLVNGRPRGTSPIMNIELEPNREYRISASLDGYRPWSARVTPVAGRNPALMASLQAAPQAVAAAPAAPSQPARRGDIRVPSAMLGSASAGRGLTSSRCGRCHGSTAGPINPRRYTQTQWTRYFATGRHGRRAMLGQSFSVRQLADVKAYLVANAADVQSDTAAGVR
ncbi:MAG: PEGA domain-containing protein [Deltaproteobacteria bacterium]|nr:PEGA domain-containing protein [Deltaproteobacteria bacterium]